MSYDFRLGLPEAGRTPEEVATTAAPYPVRASTESADDVRKQLVAAALLTGEFPLERASFGGLNSGGTEPPSGRSVELNATGAAPGIQVGIFDREAAVTLVYGPRGEAARQCFELIWRLLTTMQREGGYVVYDPQLGRILDLGADFENVFRCYQQSLDVISASHLTACERRPRGREWFPNELDRWAYFWRWCALSGASLILFYVTLRITLHTPAEVLVLIPGAGWFVAKLVVLDMSRLRSIGWAPRLAWVGIILPIGLMIQFLLFFVAPKRR